MSSDSSIERSSEDDGGNSDLSSTAKWLNAFRKLAPLSMTVKQILSVRSYSSLMEDISLARTS